MSEDKPQDYKKRISVELSNSLFRGETAPWGEPMDMPDPSVMQQDFSHHTSASSLHSDYRHQQPPAPQQQQQGGAMHMQGSYNEPMSLEPMMQDLDLGSHTDYGMDPALANLGQPSGDLNLDALPPTDSSGLAFFDTDL
jgi:catenin beta 1